MNWGHKISIVFAAFVALIVTLVVISMTQKDIHLVTEKYYEQEIAYQNQINIEESTAALVDKPKIKYALNNQMVTIDYPNNYNSENIKGTILFYRPSNAHSDFKVTVKPNDTHVQEVVVGNLEKGLWKIKMDWTIGNEKYYLEEKLVLR